MDSAINRERKLGIEIECVVPIVGQGEGFDVQQLIASVLTNQGLRACARSYSHHPVPDNCVLCVEHDSSLRDEQRYTGIRWARIELKTAALPWGEVERILPPALQVVDYLGARTNASTGLHVHHHLPEVVERPELVRNLQHMWWRFHPVIYGLVAPSRRDNQYCRPPTADDAIKFDSAGSYERLCAKLRVCDRYMGVNVTNLLNPQRMTVEWRIHSGTTDWNKIRAWVLAIQRWMEHAIARSCHHRAQPVPNTRAGLNALLVTTGLKPNSRIYRKVEKDLRQVGRFLLKRWKHFNVPNEPKERAVAA